ncbi:hypothetical protein GCM10025883_23680 [Mobilicoccus caccae]|uniref:Uncharacterized protein n=1 Tax=Mobilicoccus caccae TaxID=1859295 RepID=A0ABQ6IUF9_9MICO|nr:hypothetical protein GCM10025883_23680 [Mobilicoccus caccae]
MPARAEMSRVVVPWKPRSAKASVAAASSRPEDGLVDDDVFALTTAALRWSLDGWPVMSESKQTLTAEQALSHWR